MRTLDLEGVKDILRDWHRCTVAAFRIVDEAGKVADHLLDQHCDRVAGRRLIGEIGRRCSNGRIDVWPQQQPCRQHASLGLGFRHQDGG